MSLDQENVDNLDQSSINCFFVITSGQYGQMMDKLQKINEIIAVFVMNNEKLFPSQSSLVVS